MSDLFPFYTNDGSVGLFNPNFNDIYHSATGALTEAYEKFIFPLDENWLLNKTSVNILDICYGIGYNSKAFLNNFISNFEKFYQYKKIDIAQIHDDNINALSQEMLSPNNVAIYNDNVLQGEYKQKINITAIDTDKLLGFLSPFVKTSCENYDNTHLTFQYDKINKYLDEKSKLKPIKISPEVNLFLLSSIIKDYPEVFDDKDLNRYLFDNSFEKFFAPEIVGVFKEIKSFLKGNPPLESNLLNLHNIYYNHVPTRYKTAPKPLYLANCIFNIIFDDARKVIQKQNCFYDIVFLDAFTPTKCPCLWSIDFFKLLYSKMTEDSIILTYTNSASVRNAFINAGFKVGKIYNKRLDKYMGTIATKNKALIKTPLSEFDLGLLKTRAGIFYRDENLTALNEAIITRHKNECELSTLMSSSRYMKNWQ